MSKWVEQSPKENDTVRVHFAAFTNLGTKIGIFRYTGTGKAKIEFGDCVRFLDRQTTFEVFVQ